MEQQQVARKKKIKEPVEDKTVKRNRERAEAVRITSLVRKK